MLESSRMTITGKGGLSPNISSYEDNDVTSTSDLKVESGAQCIQIFEFGQPGSFLPETNWDGNWNAAPCGTRGVKQSL